ncbi:MAG: hypothetical protein HZY76_11685 [Anaerolineae bacterium]|nr:MAG: hypothetical protein HZY76_11685 [Anaerolineae bacterium]
MNDDLQRMLRLAAAPDAVLLVTSKEDNALQPQQESYYRLGDAVMRYYRPYDGINDFALVAEPLDLTASLMISLQYYTAGERAGPASHPGAG